jgi:primosomal protein N' (replication factor Y) (superfamily II helicase)
VLAAVVPQFLFEYMSVDKVIDAVLPDTDVAKEDVIVGTTKDRLDAYKRLIRTAFAEKKSVVFVTPTIRNLEFWKDGLEKGINKHVITLHSKMTKKDLRSTFSLIKTSERPLVMFVTPSYATIPRIDTGIVIAENESQSIYKTNDRYGTDLRIFLRAYSMESKFSLYWGDTLPRFETLERLGKSHLPRAYIPEKLHLVPIDHYRTVLPSETIELIRHAAKKKKRIFIYTHRKGIAPLSRCSDCGTIVECTSCSLPMVLRYKVNSAGERERMFLCTHCGDTLPTSHVCSYCGSWNITPVSIGTESIRDAVIDIVGEDAVMTVDDDLTPDSATVQAMIGKMQHQKFAILIGTIKVLPYLKGIHYAMFPFFDRLLSTPSLYTVEEALRLVMECNEYASDGVIVCTKTPEFPFLRQLETQKINAIIYDELTLRKELGYPPYGTLIKMSMTVPEGYRQKMADAVSAYFAGAEVTMLPVRRISQGSMKVLMSWIFTASTHYIEEEGQELNAFFNSLRFPYKIEQNPERL